MQFKQGASIFTEDSYEAGHIDRVVIDPKTKTVTHIVIRKGLLFAKDKVVPIKFIVTGEAEGITLRVGIDKLNHLPDFIETHYVHLSDEELGQDMPSVSTLVPAIYWYPPYPGMATMPYIDPPYLSDVKINIPKGTIPLEEGAKVFARDGEPIGNVEQVLTSHGDRVTHFIVSKGLVLKEKKIIPVGWIDHFKENEVRLAVRANTVEKIPSLEQA